MSNLSTVAELRTFDGIPFEPFLIFFLKLTKIFAAQGAPPVSLTPVANGKNLQ